MDEWHLSQRFTLNAGLRAVFYNMVGPYTKKQYNDDNLPTGVETSWKTNESIAFYPRLEPRASLTYLVNEQSSVKASFTQTYQFIHLATTSGASFPVDTVGTKFSKGKTSIGLSICARVFQKF
jgi:outer membrane receptor protein involved in Fe transport